MYHIGNRNLQAEFGATALADRLLEVTHHTAFTDQDLAFIGQSEFFFLATADDQGRPDCSFKGGPKGFVKVTGESQLIFPDYDGNGMFKSLGNIEINPNVGLLFITMTESPTRIRVNGRAHVLRDSKLMADFVGAQLLIQVDVDHIFPNCPRYVPDLAAGVASPYIPKANVAAKEPEWKEMALFSDVVPLRVVTEPNDQDKQE